MGRQRGWLVPLAHFLFASWHSDDLFVGTKWTWNAIRKTLQRFNTFELVNISFLSSPPPLKKKSRQVWEEVKIASLPNTQIMGSPADLMAPTLTSFLSTSCNKFTVLAARLFARQSGQDGSGPASVANRHPKLPFWVMSLQTELLLGQFWFI